MRVGLVVPRYAPEIGGVETHVERLATGLAARGHEVEVLAQATRASAETRAGVRVRRFRVLYPSRNFAFAPGLWSAVRREARRLDLLHAHSYHALPALGAGFARGAPLVFTPHFHGRGHSPLRSLLHKIYVPAGRRIFRSAAAVVCVSEPEAALVAECFHEIERKITVIPNGVDVAAIQEAQPFATRELVLLSVGRLEAYKRVELALDALAALPPEWSLTIIGTGPRSDSLRRRISALGLGGRARLLGAVPIEELRRWYRTATACVSMSTDEALGITTLEAAVAGAAVVASDIPAHRYAQALAGGSGRFVLVDPGADGAVIAAAARASAQAKTPRKPAIPTWDDVVERTLSLYEGVLAAQS